MHEDDSNQVNGPDDAVAKRLARLRNRPLNMSDLRERVRNLIVATPPVGRKNRSFTPLRAFTAGALLAVAIVAVVLATSGGPVLASATELARIHRENVFGTFNGVADAARPIVLSCGEHRLGAKRLACLALMVDGQPVTLAVSHTADIRLPKAPCVTRTGINHYVQSSGNVNIVTAQRDGLCFCLIGELPVTRLLDTAESLRF